ncbi:sel1 repeat family protein [bacterium]|nr:sel1 repeat family protein [bacterium]
MQFLSLSIIFTLFLFSGCTPSPEIPLTDKLSSYAQAQKQCNYILDGRSKLSGDVEKECEQFLKRLEHSNELENELMSKKFTKPEYAMKETEDARQRLKLKQQYEELLETVRNATLAAIRKNDPVTFTEGINFPGNTFIAPYYDYMKNLSPRFDQETHYLAYQRQESEQLVQEAQQYLDQGRDDKARALFEQAAEMHNPQAARSAALLYEDSDIEKALHWHLIAANEDVKSSYLNIARLYEAQEKQEEALKWYRKAADSGDAKAQFRLYNFYRAKDEKLALSWLEKSARNDYPQAQYSYALILLKESPSYKAIALMQQASQNGYQPASEYLGQYFYDLKRYGRAIEELSKSESANAFYLRAKMAEKGLGMQQDYRLAYDFYSHAYALGNEEAGDDAKRILSLQSEEQQRAAEEEKKLWTQRMAKMVEECGEIPTSENIKQSNKKIHITGTASAPISGTNNFIIYGDDGEQYYLKNSQGIQEENYVDVVTRSVGHVISLHYADEEPRNLYQFTYIKPCVQEDE